MLHDFFQVTQVTFRWWWKDPDFSSSLANIHTIEFESLCIQWKPDHLTNTTWKMLGFAEARRPMKAIICIDGLVFKAIMIQSCCTLSGEDKRFCSADHFGRTRRSARTQQNQQMCCGRCTWRTSEIWFVPNTCENVHIAQESKRVQTATLTMQCSRDNVWYHFDAYNMCVLLNLLSVRWK